MEKIKQLLSSGTALSVPETVQRAFNDLFSRQALTSPALAVGGTTTKFKVGTAAFVVINGVTSLVASADGPVLTGYNLTAGQVGGYLVTVDGSGVVYALPLNPAATLGGVGYPLVPASQVCIGVILINAVNPAIFTGGTSLMSGTNVTYINSVGPFYPTNAF